MFAPTLDSLDRFLELNAKVHTIAFSAEEMAEWRELLRVLLTGEIGARAHHNPGEGRRHLRTTIRLLARVQGPQGPAAIVNASLGSGGLKLYAALSWQIGDLLQLTIPLPNLLQPVRARAQVVWRRSQSLGIKFVEVTKSDREFLESAVVEAMLRAR